jgi:hypothetical protein
VLCMVLAVLARVSKVMECVTMNNNKYVFHIYVANCTHCTRSCRCCTDSPRTQCAWWHRQLPAYPWPSPPYTPRTQLSMRCCIDPLRSNCGRACLTCRARSCRCVAVPTCRVLSVADGTSSCQRIRGRARQTHHAPGCRCVAVPTHRAPAAASESVAEPAGHAVHPAADALPY